MTPDRRAVDAEMMAGPHEICHTETYPHRHNRCGDDCRGCDCPRQDRVRAIVQALADVERETLEVVKRTSFTPCSPGCTHVCVERVYMAERDQARRDLDRKDHEYAEAKAEVARLEHRGCDCGPSGHAYSDCPAYREGHAAGKAEGRREGIEEAATNVTDECGGCGECGLDRLAEGIRSLDHEDKK